jgi:hypothetical protein
MEGRPLITVVEELAMGAVRLDYGDAGDGDHSELLTDFPSLLTRIQELGRKYSARLGASYAVDVIQPNGDRLHVGIGNGQWILSFTPGDDRCGCLTSLGDERATGTVVFWFGGWTEMSRKYLVPRDAALQAVREWVERGTLSNAINWTSRRY